MGITQTQSAEQLEPQVFLPNNPFVPPKGGICLINNLPPELLSHTFELGFADDVNEDEEDIPDSYIHLDATMARKKYIHDRETKSHHVFPSFTLPISHVCQHWRNVALSTPSIWTTIVVTPGEHSPYEPVSTLLERSKSLPIDITVSYSDLEDDFEPPSDADLDILFAMLIPHIHRWRTIKVTVSEYHHMYAFLSAVSDPSVPAAPQLTTLELYHYEDIGNLDAFQHPRMANHLTLFAGSAPLLTRVVLWGVHVDWDQPWVASASNLTDLQLAYHAEDIRPSWTQFSTILRSASVLQKLSLRQSGPSGEPPVWSIEPTPEGPADVNAPIQLVRVTDFILEYNTQARTIGLLRKFYLPALKHLALDSEVYIGDDFGDLFRELTRPASPVQEQPRSLASRLESLKIPALPCDVECFKTLYGELQNLRSLNLLLYYYDPFFLNIISTPCTLPGHGDIWLPRLATLYVYGASWIALRNIVLQRKEAGVPLTSLYVDQECPLDAENVDWLKENVKTFKFIGDREGDVFDFDWDVDDDEWSDVD
ncbi:hypothetical protein L210DRAFT_3539010 [Boletus edulis BED1]|uniref:F-box domain-containing protein n=1 Tax=Boletus edulis BED1 TaxID=1328754 RepID=A0AAD4BWD4_BOLED|nr:hypothetical protein L210DRAFT_3539010 [Boletus edulis BED1]